MVLGFTHQCRVNRNGKFMVARTTMRKRLTAKLKGVKEELRKRMHESTVKQGKWLASIVRGYCQYHTIPGNWEVIGAFRTQVARLWFRTLKRRSPKSNLDWERMTILVNAWLPKARILHPWSEQRFADRIRDKSLVR